MTIRLHAVLPLSRANGPGIRTVIWFQGCTLGCRGCFNPQTHAAQAGEARPVADLVDEIAARAETIAGVTISGGEPFQQPRGLLVLLQGIRSRTSLSTLVFSGYRLTEIEAIPEGPAILALIDVLIAGRYVPARHVGEAMQGSTNQQIHLLTNRHRLSELVSTPSSEIQIDPRGRITVTGIMPLNRPLRRTGSSFAEATADKNREKSGKSCGFGPNSAESGAVRI